MFRYAQIEAAIAKIHNVPANAMKTFRSRIRNFQRIGLVPSSPGKGQKIDYSVDYAIYWALCFELVEVGLPPNIIKAVMTRQGYGLINFFVGAVHGEDRFYCLIADFLSWQLLDDGTGKSAGQFSTGILTLSELQRQVFAHADRPRVILINLTSMKRKLGDALEIDWGSYVRDWDPATSPALPQAGDFAG